MSSVLVWIRRDLRCHDHPALSRATQLHDTVYVVFNFDPAILDPIRAKTVEDFRLHFIAQSLSELDLVLRERGGRLILSYGSPLESLPELAEGLGVRALYFNEDYETYPIERDAAVSRRILEKGIAVHSFQDHVMVHPNALLKDDGTPFKVFTPYYKKWRALIDSQECVDSWDIRWPSLELSTLLLDQVITLAGRLNAVSSCRYSVGNVDSVDDSVGSMGSADFRALSMSTQSFDPNAKNVSAILRFSGFRPSEPPLIGGTQAGLRRLKWFSKHMDAYDHQRDFPAKDGTSLLSVYLRHGCISIRDMARLGLSSNTVGAEKWLSEMAWREFYCMIAFHFLYVKTQPFQSKYSALVYEKRPNYLQAWKEGKTGFPLVDAAMRCLNHTGLMHNRLRMLTASVLCKTLRVDWREGEAYFALKLLDYEFFSNNGGWQWVAGVGADAAPYFRIFNPYTQSIKFDPDGVFIRKWVEELAHLDAKTIHHPYQSSPNRLDLTYPKPIVDYAESRKETLLFYRSLEK